MNGTGPTTNCLKQANSPLRGQRSRANGTGRTTNPRALKQATSKESSKFCSTAARRLYRLSKDLPLRVSVVCPLSGFTACFKLLLQVESL